MTRVEGIGGPGRRGPKIRDIGIGMGIITISMTVIATFIIVTWGVFHKEDGGIDHHVDDPAACTQIAQALSNLQTSLQQLEKNHEVSSLVITRDVADVAAKIDRVPTDVNTAVMASLMDPNEGPLPKLTALYKDLNEQGGLLDAIREDPIEYLVLDTSAAGLDLADKNHPGAYPELQNTIFASLSSSVPGSCETGAIIDVGPWGIASAALHVYGTCSPDGPGDYSISTYRLYTDQFGYIASDPTSMVVLRDGIQRAHCSITALPMPDLILLVCSVPSNTGGNGSPTNPFDDVMIETYHAGNLLHKIFYTPSKDELGETMWNFKIAGGSGMISGDEVFIAWHARVDTDNPDWLPLFCPKDLCPTATVDQCNGGRFEAGSGMYVQGYIAYNLHSHTVTQKMINPRIVGEGTQASFLRHGQQQYFYKASRGWFREPQVWRIGSFDDHNSWERVPIPAIRLTGNSVCPSGNSCPKVCKVGSFQQGDHYIDSAQILSYYVAQTNQPSDLMNPSFYYGDNKTSGSAGFTYSTGGPAVQMITRLFTVAGRKHTIIITEKGPALMGPKTPYLALIDWKGPTGITPKTRGIDLKPHWLLQHSDPPLIKPDHVCPSTPIYIKAICKRDVGPPPDDTTPTVSPPTAALEELTTTPTPSTTISPYPYGNSFYDDYYWDYFGDMEEGEEGWATPYPDIDETGE